jgi:hypothetical protein
MQRRPSQADTATGRPERRMSVVSTEGVGRAERFDYWRAVNRQICIPLDACRDGDDDFSAEQYGMPPGEYRLMAQRGVTAEPNLRGRDAR